MNVAIFLPNWVGDAAMATPTLRAVRRHFGPDSRLIGVMRPYVAGVLSGTTWLDHELHYDPKSPAAELGSRTLIGQLRRRKLDLAILLPNSLRTGFLAWAGGARRRVGYARNGRGWLLSQRLYHPRQGRRWLPTPAIDAYLQLAYAVGCPSESPQIELATLPADEDAADRVWRQGELPSGDQVVMLNSGGAYGAAKLWPTEYFAELARRIAIQDELAVLVNCGPSERQVASEIVRGAAHPRVVGLAETDVSLGLSKACIRRSRLLVTTDSGPRFFAAAFGVPAVCLFGPTDQEWSRTHHAGEICLQRQVPCGPCHQRQCPLVHHRCMRELSVDQVHQAVRRQLGRSTRVAAAVTATHGRESNSPPPHLAPRP